MKRLFLLFAFIFVCALGCRKEYPVSTNGTPVFYFNGTVNNEAVSLKAGVNNYYMYSFFTQDSFQVYNFFGELKQNNCTNCNNSIKFQINDDTTSPINGSTQANSSLTANYYSIQLDSAQTGSSTDYIIQFHSLASPADSATNYSWNFGDGATDQTPNPTHTYSHPGYYNVCLTITYSNGLASTICNNVNIGVPDATCSVTIVDSVLSTSLISFSSFQTGPPPYIYALDFGDGNSITGTSSNGFYGNHNYNNPGVYKVCLQLVDANGCNSHVCKNVSTQDFSGGPYTNFDFTVQGVTSNSLSLSNVIIKWTDNSGNVYSSNAVSQPGSSYFQIVSVENYLNNENHQPTKKLHVKFKCNVSNGSNVIPITNGDAVIAVSYR